MVLLFNVVCIRFSVLAEFFGGLAILDDFFFGLAVSNIPQCPPQSCISSHKAAKVLSNSYKKLACLDHFTVVCLVAWPLNESEAGVDLVLIETSLLFICKLLLITMGNSMINMRKAGRFLSKQGHLQPQFHSRASKKL